MRPVTASDLGNVVPTGPSRHVYLLPWRQVPGSQRTYSVM